MPELPEVETCKRAITPKILGQQIEKITLKQRKLRWPINKEIRLLHHSKIQQILRRGKYIILRTDKGDLLIHLGMSGRLHFAKQHSKMQKHEHVAIQFVNNICLRFHDPRRFGAILWSENYQQHFLIHSLGIEPLSDDFNAEYLFIYCNKSNTAIKKLIMDQKIVVGVGNIYANEALFAAKIHPETAAKKLKISDCKRLVFHIKEILNYAIQQGGTTLKDFADSDGKPGYFQLALKVYDKAGLPCENCGTILQLLRINQRSTVFCAQCQIKV